MPAWTRLDTALLVAVTGVAAVLRLGGLASPAELVFDELFYAQNACLLAAAAEVCGVAEPLSNAHPPLGQWLIAAGIAVMGYDPFGWRVVAFTVGTATVALTYVLARLVLRGASPRAAAIGSTIAAGLLAIDLLHLALSRVAMLDVFLVFFVVAAFLAVALDVSHPPRRGRGGIGQWLFGRSWRLLAGVLIGAAVAVKWSGLYLALGIVGLVVAWEVVVRRWDTSGTERSWGRAFVMAFRDEWLRSAVLLGLIPLLVYVATYVGVADGSILAPPWREGAWFYDVAHHQVAMARFHFGLEGHHPYESPSWSWFLLKRPVAFHFEERGLYREILAVGSPVAWGLALAALAWLAASWVRGYRTVGAAVVLMGALCAYLPWLIFGFARSQIFVWYVLPSLPFLYIAVGIAAVRWRRWARTALGVGLALAVATFLFFWPLATATPLSPNDWQMRMWFTDCERPGAPTLTLPDDTVNSGPPPDGWCWI